MLSHVGASLNIISSYIIVYECVCKVYMQPGVC